MDSEFEAAYDKLVKTYGTDYAQIGHDFEAISKKFLNNYQSRRFYNFQEFDFEGLLGRLTSSSYIPKPGQARYDEMVAALREIFDRYQSNGRVRIEYNTDIFFARVHA